jgi:hypothetical protein
MELSTSKINFTPELPQPPKAFREYPARRTPVSTDVRAHPRCVEEELIL